MDLLDGELAAIINDAAGFMFLNATLVRDVPGTIVDPSDPPTPTQATYTCKAIEDKWSTGFLANGLVDAKDINILILANSFKLNDAAVTFEPKALDRITIRGVTVTIVSPGSGRVAVETDPARATFSCRCSR